MDKRARLIGIIGFFFLVGCTQAEDITTIGFIGPLTGDVAYIGQSQQKGIEIALTELNTPKQQFDIVYEDGKCSGKDAINAYNKLVSTKKIDAIITTCSPELLAIAPLAKTDDILVISPSATAATITKAGKHVYRVVPSDALQGIVGANLLEEYDRVGILYINHDYGVGLEKTLQEELDNIVISEAFAPSQTDFRTELTKIKKENVDVLYIVAFSKEAAFILKQVTELNIDAQIIAAEAAKGEDILPYGEGVLITVPQSKGSDYQSFSVKHNAVYGSDPGLFAAESYDTVKILAKAKGFGNLLPGIAYVKSHDGAAGSITFDENGDVDKPYDLITVQQGEFVVS